MSFVISEIRNYFFNLGRDLVDTKGVNTDTIIINTEAGYLYL